MTKRKQSVMTKDDILGIQDFKVVQKKVKAWDNKVVCFREISGQDGLAYNDYIQELKKTETEISAKTSLTVGVRLLSMMLSDEEGNLLFTEADIEELSKKSLVAITELIGYAAEVAGVNSAAIDEAKNKLKNSQPDASASS